MVLCTNAAVRHGVAASQMVLPVAAESISAVSVLEMAGIRICIGMPAVAFTISSIRISMCMGL